MRSDTALCEIVAMEGTPVAKLGEPPGPDPVGLTSSRLIGGEGACPPENCGGAPGYEHLREILADPGDEEHDDMLTWLGLDHAAEFDPAAFDVEAVNRRLVAVGSPR